MEKRLIDILVCPVTKGKLIIKDDELWSRSAALAYPVRDGIPVLIKSEARTLEPAELATLERS